ncbi:hypothetical protein ACFQX4_22305 [Roseomonas sp. GCM10028921]
MRITADALLTDTSAPLRARLGRARTGIPLATWLATWLRSKLAASRSAAPGLSVERLNEGMLRDIGLRADHFPAQTPDAVLFAVRAGGGVPL